MAREKSPLCLSFNPFGSSVDPWIVRYVVDERGFWLQFNDDYGNGSSVLSAREIHGMTGFDPDDLESEELGEAGRIYGLPESCPLLSVPFTAEQFLEFDRRAGHFFSDFVGQGDATEEWLTELEKRSPEAVELARVILSGKASDGELIASSLDEAKGLGFATSKAAIDYARLATPQQLIDAFGRFTGMDASWFESLSGTPKLLGARRQPGKSGRNHLPPLFCPYAVMTWLIDPKRKKGRPIEPKTGWRRLKEKFPKAFEAYGVGVELAD